MATINSTSTTAGSYNYINVTFMRTGMRCCRYTDRKVSSTYGRGALMSRLGAAATGDFKQEATLTNPFLNRTS